MAKPTPNSPVAVAWRGVGKIFPDGHRALGGVSLEARRGEVLAILGTSGSGKTTLLRLVNRLIDPSSGEVVVGGRATTAWDPIELRLSMGYVIQEAGLMPHMNILANVGLVPRLKGIGKAERETAAIRCLNLVGLDAKIIGERFPHQLSGGQRQRVGVARALASDPDLILMDEPFGALDPITRREIQDEFRSLQRNLGKTVILVTHDLREACRMADHLALVDHGMLIQYGEPIDFLERPANDFVRSFFQDARAVTPIAEGALP
jgi:osmoprotectant transport system ATP-binding protein